MSRRKKELTPDQNRERWIKKYQKKTYYFVYPQTEEGYQQALEAWWKKKAEMDAAQIKPHVKDYADGIKLREELAAVALLEGEHQLHRQMMAEIKLLRRLVGQVEPPPFPRDMQIDPVLALPNKVAWMDKIDAFRKHQQWNGRTPQEKLLGTNVHAYLATIRGKAEAGDVSLAYYSGLRQFLARFVQVVGKDTNVDAIRGPTLTSFYQSLSKEVADKKISRATASATMKKAVGFIKWMAANDVIDSLPKNIASRDIRFKVPPKKVPVFTVQEIHELLSRSHRRRQLYWLLMLNCGFNQQDLADLLKSEVDLTNGTITRKRSKTKDNTDTPEVTYFLWPETLELLKEFRSDHPTLFLLSQVGKPLLYRRLVGEKVRKQDSVFGSVRKLGLSKPIKVLRKTSATMLLEHNDAQLADYFLGHSPRSMLDKHYGHPPQEKLRAALTWLRDQYLAGLPSLLIECKVKRGRPKINLT